MQQLKPIFDAGSLDTGIKIKHLSTAMSPGKEGESGREQGERHACAKH
jgi:hypothetical protein